MAKPKSNMLVLVGAGFLALIVIAGLMFRFYGADISDRITGKNKVQDAKDTPRESLTAMSSKLTGVRETVDELAKKMAAGTEASAEEQAKLLERARKEAAASNKNVLDVVQQQFEALSKKIEQQKEYEVNKPVPQGGQLRNDGRIWFGQPGTSAAGGTGGIQTLPDRIKGKLGSLDFAGIRSAGGNPDDDNPQIPAYTIPSNSTLIGSKAITALIGRVPIGGQLRDPVPFKIVTGAENLTANDMYLPEVEKMIWSGYAAGDGAIKCATGKVTSVTFVFRDGTILTQDAKQPDVGLGWISNDQGYPCIPGTYVSNAPEVMRKLFGAGFASGAAGALAQAQTQTTVTTGGALATTVTGDTGEFAIAQGLAAGFSEWSRYVAERARDLFDAIVVHPGEVVAINTTEPILIDYGARGRKIRHVANLAIPATKVPSNGGLD